MPVAIEGFHHVGLLVTDVERAASFYEGVLGLRPIPRPDFGFPGRWYELGRGQQLHLMGTAERPGPHREPTFDRHVALLVPDVEEAARQLAAAGIEFARGSGRSGQPQLFVRDPDGNLIELR
jgi:glyoxylase I family protein